MLEIVRRCGVRGVEVSKALGGFVGRVVMENDPVAYPPEGDVSSKMEDVIASATDRLCQEDSPAMETMKMQASFESTFAQFGRALRASREARDSVKRDLAKSVLGTRPKNANDFDALNLVYKRIFQFLLKVSKGSESVVLKSTTSVASFVEKTEEESPSGDWDRSKFLSQRSATTVHAEREVAAALESVLPRIGLKAFVHLSTQDKRAQLEELAKVVTGIRLFNKATGKGGAGFSDSQDEVVASLENLREALEAETAEQQKVAARYQETLVYCHLRQPQGVEAEILQRWGQELTNRRQYGAYLMSLAEDASASKRRAAEKRDLFYKEIDDLKQLVGQRASVPKDQVYPKFEALATYYFDLDDELRLVETRAAALSSLQTNFKESYVATLPARHPVFRAAKLEQQTQKNSHTDEEAAMAQAIADLDDDDDHQTKKKTARRTNNQDQNDDSDDSDDDEKPLRLSVESTPEFMQLPLEYQGFCGWTVANRHGLLLPGKPGLGVVKYRGGYYVFAHAVALKAFMRRPRDLKRQVLERAKTSPELIHLLRLQDQENHGTFVANVIARAARPDKNDKTLFDPKLLEDNIKAPTKDASTGTPTHFIDTHIDHNYDWNVWALRRRALRVAQLKHCATTSQQTDQSHFRRDSTSQVYLPKIQATQTRRDNHSNPPTRIQYLTGARGPTSNKFTKQKQPAAGIVDLTFDLSTS